MIKARRLALMLITCCAAIGTTPVRVRGQTRFKSSLTATVIIPSSPERGKSDPLGCRQVILRWAAHAAARRYVVYVSVRTDGPWSELPANNVCGAIRWNPPTGVTDVEPTLGAPAVVRHLYYKVVALAGPDPGAAALEVTDPVSVELP